MTQHLLVLSLTFLICCVGCSGGGGGGSAGGSSGSSGYCVDDVGGSANAGFTASAGLFTFFPIDVNKIGNIIPLGQLNPPAHTYPTPHNYFYFSGVTSSGTPVLAAAGGTVTKIYRPDGVDYKIIIKVDQSFYYFYDHMWSVTSGVAVGTTVVAGQQLGLAGGGGGIGAAALDFGVLNYNQTLSGIINTCLFVMQLHADAPIKFYSPANQTTLYAKVNRSGPEQNGKIDYDIAGKLSGAWLVEGTAQGTANGASGWSKQLLFGYDTFDPTKMRISVGGTLVNSGSVYAVQTGGTDFGLISSASGMIAYRLYQVVGGSQTPNLTQDALMLVQMLTDTRIKVQIISPSTASTGSFDSTAVYYTR